MSKEIENFIYFEANLLDELRYQEWQELFTKDSIYWIPSWKSESELISNPENELSIVYWNKQNIDEYVQRLLSGEAHVMVPTPRTIRHITNVTVYKENESEFVVKSNWLLHDYRLKYNNGIQQFFGGQMEHRIVKEKDSLKIAWKKVIVINDDISRGHLLIV